MTESEFDRKISEELSNINITDKIHDTTVTAWFVPFKYISWGLILTSITLNLWGLEIILPLIGNALIFLGMRMLRNSGKAFRSAYILSLIFLMFHLISTCLSTVVPEIALGTASEIIRIALLLTLRHAVIMTDSEAIEKPSKDPFIWSVVMKLSVYVLALVPDLVPVTGFIWIVLFIIVARLIFKTGEALNRDCCVLQDSKIRINGKVVMCMYLAVGIACFLFINHPILSFEPYETPDIASQARVELSENGFPEKAVQCISESEVEFLNDFDCVVQVTEDDKVYFEQYNQRTSENGEVVYDETKSVSNTKMYFTDRGGTLYVMEYFEMGENLNSFWGDGVFFWNTYGVCQVVGGALFYIKDGELFRYEIQDFNQLSVSSMFFSNEGKCSFKVSFPLNCEKRYGYVIYKTGLIDTEGWRGCCSLDWYHRNFPICTPYDVKYASNVIDVSLRQFYSLFDTEDFNNKHK